MQQRVCKVCLRLEKLTISLWQVTSQVRLYSKKQFGQWNFKSSFLIVESCIRTLQSYNICVSVHLQVTVHVFLGTGETLMSFLPLAFRLFNIISSSSPVCCLAKLTNTCTTTAKNCFNTKVQNTKKNCFTASKHKGTTRYLLRSVIHQLLISSKTF